MHKQKKYGPDDQGFVLVAALLIMLVLTIIGIATTTNTSIELQIAGNDKVHKKTFYEADAGSLLGAEILEQAFNCPLGFTKISPAPLSTVDVRDIDDTSGIATIRVYSRGPSGSEDLVLWNNEEPTSAVIGDIEKAHVSYPIDKLTDNDLGDGVETGHLYFGGYTNMLPGGALEMAAGYEGKGKSSAQGGVGKYFNIYSQFKGKVNSQSIVLLGWRHIIGAEGICNYDD